MPISLASRGIALSLLLATALVQAAGIDEQQLVEKAATASTITTEAATLALRTSESSEIKGYAQRIIDDYPKGSADLQAFARGRQLSMPPDSVLRRRAAAELKPLQERQFDSRFAALQVRHLEASLALFSQAIEQGDTELQDFARSRMPVLKHQLQNARLLTATHPAS